MLPYGRYDNPMAPTVEAKMQKLSRRQRYRRKKQWFSRCHLFNHAFRTWNLENVEDMTDEQYTEALDAVHDMFSAQRHLRLFWKLQEN